MPFFTCIILSHNKPVHLLEALESVVRQTYPDWEAIVFDSGTLYDQGFFDTVPAMKDPRVRLLRSWETDELRKTRTIASWCFNECFRKDLVRGQFVTYLCDDDRFYPNAFEDFHRHAQASPGVLAMYGSIDMTVINTRGERHFLKELLADAPRGSCCSRAPIDGHVDYLQLCHHVDIMRLLPGDEYWPEDRKVIRHADGVFMEAIGKLVPIQPVPAKIGENRKVPTSLNDGGDRIDLLEEICHAYAETRRLKQMLSPNGEVPIRYRIADHVNAALKRFPRLHELGRKMVLAGWRKWRNA